MPPYSPIDVRIFYRSSSHLPIWEVIRAAGIWEKVGINLTAFEYCGSPPETEAALFDEKIDVISGDHLTPYGLVAQGKPIVSLASPVNAKSEKIISRAPVESLPDLRGRRIADTAMEGRDGGFHHARGNHMMYLIRAGVALDEVEWIDIEGSEQRLQAVVDGEADAVFDTGDEAKLRALGLHVLALPPLPMINGPTLTSSLKILRKKDRLGERLVKAMVLGIHFARTRREETEKILAGLNKREGKNFRYSRLARYPIKPYPDAQAVINAYELGCMKSPEARNVSPMALWDLHYLRELDDSGFIDRLYQNGEARA